MGGTHIALAGRLVRVKDRGQGLRSPTAEAGRARHRPAVGSRGGGILPDSTGGRVAGVAVRRRSVGMPASKEGVRAGACTAGRLPHQLRPSPSSRRASSLPRACAWSPTQAPLPGLFGLTRGTQRARGPLRGRREAGAGVVARSRGGGQKVLRDGVRAEAETGEPEPNADAPRPQK